MRKITKTTSLPDCAVSLKGIDQLRSLKSLSQTAIARLDQIEHTLEEYQKLVEKHIEVRNDVETMAAAIAWYRLRRGHVRQGRKKITGFSWVDHVQQVFFSKAKKAAKIAKKYHPEISYIR